MATNNAAGSSSDKNDEGGCCGCVGCLVMLAALMALAGSWWAWVPFVIAAIVYNLFYVKDDSSKQSSDKGNKEWWRLD